MGGSGEERAKRCIAASEAILLELRRQEGLSPGMALATLAVAFATLSRPPVEREAVKRAVEETLRLLDLRIEQIVCSMQTAPGGEA